MIIFTTSEKLGFTPSFNEDFENIIERLSNAFISKYSLETFERADKIVVVEDKFYNVIKDKYGAQIIGEYLEEDSLDNIVNQYLNI